MHVLATHHPLGWLKREGLDDICLSWLLGQIIYLYESFGSYRPRLLYVLSHVDLIELPELLTPLTD